MTNEMIARLFEFREELGRSEMSVMKRMAQYWAETERFIRNETEALVEAVPIQLVRTWDRYRRYTEQARTQLETYDAAVQPIIEQGIRANLQLGLDSANEALELAYSGVDAPSWSRLNVEAVEQMAGMLRSSTALGSLLRRGSDLAFDGAEEALIRGLALGRGANQVAADIADAAGFSFEQSILIARTEMNRAYRFASTAQYRDSGVVTGFRRLVYKPTACFACLMMDGEYYLVGQELYDHPRGKCGAVPVTVGGHSPSWETGPEWFAKLPKEEQRRIMGAGRYELWKSGNIRDLKTFVTMRPNVQWGPAPFSIAIKDLPQYPNGQPIDFRNGGSQRIADLANLQSYYSPEDSGRDFAVSKPVIYNEFASRHLAVDDIHSKRFDWIEANESDFIRAITNPELIEKDIRVRRDGYHSVTHIVKVTHPTSRSNEFMAVAITLSKEPGLNGYHQITTIHPQDRRNLFYSSGETKKKYTEIK